MPAIVIATQLQSSVASTMLCLILPQKSLTFSQWLLIRMTGVGISSNAVIVVDVTIILPPRARVAVLFMNIVVNARAIYDQVLICWYLILTCNFNRNVHWAVTSI